MKSYNIRTNVMKSYNMVYQCDEVVHYSLPM